MTSSWRQICMLCTLDGSINSNTNDIYSLWLYDCIIYISNITVFSLNRQILMTKLVYVIHLSNLWHVFIILNRVVCILLCVWILLRLQIFFIYQNLSLSATAFGWKMTILVRIIAPNQNEINQNGLHVLVITCWDQSC